MNKVILSLVILTSIYSCEFHQSVNTDLKTGMTTRGDGLGVDDIIIEIDETAENRNEFIFGEMVNIKFNNMVGFEKIKNKVFPGIRLVVIETGSKDTLISEADLLKDFAEGTDISPLLLEANFITALPCTNGEKYNLEINIWDKKGEGKFDLSMPFTVKENQSLSIKEEGIGYDAIYLWDNKKNVVIPEGVVNTRSDMLLLYEGVTGLIEDSGIVYPALVLRVFDSKGNIVMSKDNLLIEYVETGTDSKTLHDQLPVTLQFPKGQINNPVTVESVLSDLKSDRKITVTAELEIK